jgi:ComEC/Rec2-related protein
MSWWFFRRKLHVSWLIAFGCAGTFIGVFLAQYIRNFYISSIFSLIVAILLIGVTLWRKYIYLIPLLIIGGILFGLWRGSVSQDELAQFEPLYNKVISISGNVKDDVDTGSSSGQIVIRLDGLTMGDKSLSGTLWITATGDDIKRGDKLLLNGTLKEGFGNFSGVIYRANIDKVIHPQPGDVARIVRDWFADAVRRAISDPEASLGIGYLVGQRRSLPVDLALALQIAGLTHVVVASGYNLTILVRLARRLFVKISKYLSALSAVTMIVAFIAITGMSPSMSRAGLVSVLSLAAWYYGRKFHPIVLLLLAIAATVIINPSYAWGDLGWQLSFAAFAGVMIVAPLTQRYLFGDKKPGMIPQILGETISAQLVTAPIIIASFGQLSNVAIISNLLVLPLVPLAMLLTFIAGVGSLAIPMVALITGLPATWLLHYMVSVAEYLASLPWAMSSVQIPWWGVALYYGVIISACLYMWRVTKYNLRDVNLVE